jgi:two-component system sensor kinase FixL
VQSELVHVARLSTTGQAAATIAHELTQPLTAVGNDAGALSRLLAAGDGNTAGMHENVDWIRKQTFRAGEVIRRQRDHVAKRNTMRLHEDVNAVAKEAMELGLVGTRHQAIQTTIELDEAVGMALIARIQIGQVLINLVRNAAEASEQRELNVATLAVAGGVEIVVTDSGPAIAPEIEDRLFRPFVMSKVSGLGLGLSICSEIAATHGGEVTASSGATGGAVFTVRLPTVVGR